jgi:hypothetical protein
MSERMFRRLLTEAWPLGGHVVVSPKYWCRVLGGRAARLGELVEQIAVERSWQMVAKEGMPADYVNQCICAGATAASSPVAQAFNGRTPRVLQRKFAHLHEDADVLWSPWYLARRSVICRSRRCVAKSSMSGMR